MYVPHVVLHTPRLYYAGYIERTMKSSVAVVVSVTTELILPLSETEVVLLKYCSSTVHAVSLTLLVTPQKPLQFTLIAAGENTKAQWVR